MVADAEDPDGARVEAVAVAVQLLEGLRSEDQAGIAQDAMPADQARWGIVIRTGGSQSPGAVP